MKKIAHGTRDYIAGPAISDGTGFTLGAAGLRCVRYCNRSRGTDTFGMIVTSTELPEVKIFQPKKIGDSRGFFSETYSVKAMRDAGFTREFVQDNHSLSANRGVVRGLHFQLPPMAQDKLVRVIRGSILDVAVDVRRGSPSFGKHISVVISAENWKQILVPIGFAHGFVTLEPNTEVIYKVTNFYSQPHDRGIRWDDPAIGINWGISPDQATVSEKDQRNPLLANMADLFEFDESQST